MKKKFYQSILLSFCFMSVLHTMENPFFPRDVFESAMTNNRRAVLNQPFNEGEMLVNLMRPDDIDVKTYQNHLGHIQTHYQVLPQWRVTFKEYGICIAPLMESTKPDIRPQRLDGQGFGKAYADGSFKLGTFNLKKSSPIPNSIFSSITPLTLAEDLHKSKEDKQKQRRPESLQGKNFSRPKPRIPSKPTPEELQAIKESQQQARQHQLDQLSSRFRNINLDILTDTTSLEKIKALELGFSLLEKNTNSESSFPILFKSTEQKINDLETKMREMAWSTHNQFTSSPTIILSTDTTTKQVKEEAHQQITKQTEKEEKHLTRPNADPLGKEVIEETKQQMPILPSWYVFKTRLNHKIINSFQEMLIENITISREELSHFVNNLKDAEYEERQAAGETIALKDLDYFYAEDQGKGSHIKVKFGRGTKPLILSLQGRLLTIDQLQDLKTVLETKGLL